MNRTVPLWLAGLALGALLALLIAPQTRWLARVQWTASLGLYHPFPWCLPDADSYTLSRRGDRAREDAVAARRPGDFPLQLAHTTTVYAAREQQIARLRALKGVFPNTPSLEANALRYATLSAVHFSRSEEYLLSGEPMPKTDAYSPPPTAAADTAAFDQDCADGERLDPDNAFFPFMRAVGLFAAHRDAEALAAVRREGTKTQWNEDLADEPTGQWRLHEEAYGDPNALWREQSMADVLLPEYARLRAVARVATYLAVEDERAGRRQDGMAIRHALMRCGGLMRAQSKFVIGSLVGIAITQVAAGRPGGTPPLSIKLTPSEQERANRGESVYLNLRTAAYLAYLHKIGQDDEARWVQSETAAAIKARAIINNGQLRPDLNKPYVTLSALWAADLLVIGNVLWLLLLGGVAALMRRRTAPAQAAAPPKVRPFLWAGLLVLAECIVWAVWVQSDMGAGSSWGGGLLLALTVVVIVRMAFANPTEREILGRRLRTILRTLVGAALVLGVVIALARWQTQNVVSVIRLERSLLGLSGDDATPTPLDELLPGLCVLASLALPLLVALTSLGAGLARRVPASDALRGGFRAAAPPLAALLLLTYGGLTLATLRQERALNAQMAQTLTGEGPAWAEEAGQSWPGVTP